MAKKTNLVCSTCVLAWVSYAVPVCAGVMTWAVSVACSTCMHGTDSKIELLQMQGVS